MNIVKKLKIVLLIVVLLNSVKTQAQSVDYTRNVINILAAEEMQGRGYVNDGDKKAAKYISTALDNFGLETINGSYFQTFTFPINTFPGKMNVSIDNNNINPVYDFVVSPDCPSIKGTFPLLYLPEAIDTDSTLFDSLATINYSGKFIVAPLKKRKITRTNPFNASGIIIPKKNLIWWASTANNVNNTPIILLTDSLIENRESITLNIEQKFHETYLSQNIIAKIKGSHFPDSVLVLSAHYDHLGTMGKNNVFRGANDNASGTAMLLSLAKHFSQSENKPKYTIVFMFFSGEECGILGSKYYSEHPLFPLSNIKMLINLDMVGTGSKGFAIVNGKKNINFTTAIQKINNEHQYFPEIKVRGSSCNSDHCYFDKAGVPAVFIYTMGDEFKEYHNLKDIPESLPLTKFSELQNLLTNYILNK